jgi:uncharacterized membrane protein
MAYPERIPHALEAGVMSGPATSTTTSTGLAPNVAGALSYLFGIITGVIFFVLEKDNQFVRFHAMQSILVNATFIVLAIILSIFSVIPILGWIVGLLGNMILGIVAIILWLVLMFKAFQGQEWEVPIIGKYARQYSSSATI